MKRYERYYIYLAKLFGYDRDFPTHPISHKKLFCDGYMDLVIEYLPDNHISLCHYGEQHGDAMRDPEVVFRLDREHKTAQPMYFRNDYLGIEQEVPEGYRSKSLDSFCDTWFKNIHNQGFANILLAA